MRKGLDERDGEKGIYGRNITQEKLVEHSDRTIQFSEQNTKNDSVLKSP